MAAAPGVVPAVRVRDLVMSYGDLRAVDNISFEVAEGEFFGILGPNGAGKTTTLEMIEGLRRPDSGEALLLGEPSWPRNTRLLRRVGVQLQASAFFERLTALEQLRTFAALYDVPGDRAEEWLERVGLTDKSGTRTEDLSGGQAQRLGHRLRPGARARHRVPRRADGRRSTRRPGATSGTCSKDSTSRDGRSCSPRTTWTRPRSSATGWR